MLYEIFFVIVGVLVGWQFPQPSWAKVWTEVLTRRGKQAALFLWKFLVAFVIKK